MVPDLKLKLLTLSMLICLTGQAQKLASLTVHFPVDAGAMGVTAQANLDEVSFLDDSLLVLTSIQNGKRVNVPFQIRHGRQRMITWMAYQGSKGAKTTVFELSKGQQQLTAKSSARLQNGELTIHQGDQNLLRYVYKTVYPPAGIDTAYRRSGFIHPLWTPNGQVLTRIQPADHYHHYGIWNPWTHVLFEGDTVDFWNLKDKKGTVRFSKFVSVAEGPVYSEFSALHEHVRLRKDGSEKVALNELQTVRVYKPTGKKDHYFVDVTIELNCAGESPFHILEYRYAGLGWRATEKWNRDNSELLSSEGKVRKESDGSNARWFYFQGQLDQDYGGALMMSYPSNFNHPEPVRVWPENSNKTGDVFAMFAPTKNRDWIIEPGKTYALKYRFVVYNGHFDQQKAESAWNYFGNPVRVTVAK